MSNNRKPSAGAQFEGVATGEPGARETVPILDDAIARLEDQVQRACDKIDRLEAKLTEAAAFLDGLAKWLEVGGIWNTGHDPAADCRAMAKKLREGRK